MVAGSFLFVASFLAYTHTGHTGGSTSSLEETSDIHVISLAAATTETAAAAAASSLPPLPEPAATASAPPPVVKDARQTWGRGQQRRQPLQKASQAPLVALEPLPEPPVLAAEEEEEEAEEVEIEMVEEEEEEEKDGKLEEEFEADIFEEDPAEIWGEEEYEEEDAAALEELAEEEEEEEEESGDLDAESWDDNNTLDELDELDDGPADEEGVEKGNEEELEEVEEEYEPQQREKQHPQQQEGEHEKEEEEEDLAPVAASPKRTHTDADLPLIKPKPVRKIQKQKQPHHQAEAKEKEKEKEEEKKGVVVVPQMLYCLPGGGFNDIVVQLWRCVEYAVKTHRVLILGWENYLPVIPPYEQYFYLREITGLTLMSQWEAASIIRAAQAAGQRVTHSAGRRLDLMALLGTGEEKEDGPPFFINAASMPNCIFKPEKTYTHHVLVYHKKGNRGTPEPILQHLLFSQEVKQTFLSRWGKLDKPYVGMHVRGTDRKCGDKKAPKVLEKVQKLRKRLKGAPVYLATDNPDAAAEQIEELEGRQGREIVSFTYYPAEEEEAKEGVKEEDEEEGKAVPLHLNKALSDEEKHQTNIDGFVDLLLLAFSQKFIMSCGGYSHLAKLLHEDKGLALGTLGLELEEGSEDVDAVLEEALQQQNKEAAAAAAAAAAAE